MNSLAGEFVFYERRCLINCHAVLTLLLGSAVSLSEHGDRTVVYIDHPRNNLPTQLYIEVLICIVQCRSVM